MNPGGEQLALRDIHLPDGIAWWPPAPGWWGLLGLIVVIAGITFFLYRRWQRRRLYRAAGHELNRIQTALAQHGDAQQFIQSISIWLRRVCLSCYPRAEVAGLTGRDWLAFLDQQWTADKPEPRFSQELGQLLITAPYQPHSDIDSEALLQLCRDWLRQLPRQRRPRP